MISVPSTVYDEKYYWEQDGPGSWKQFLETGGKWHSPAGIYLMSLGQLQDGMRVLDVGSGRGEFVFHVFW